MQRHSNGRLDWRANLNLIASLEDLPAPPAVTSDRIKALLGRALTDPQGLAPDEIREIAASVVFHLLWERAKEG